VYNIADRHEKYEQIFSFMGVFIKREYIIKRHKRKTRFAYKSNFEYLIKILKVDFFCFSYVDFLSFTF